MAFSTVREALGRAIGPGPRPEALRRAPLFLHARGLAAQLAQVVELGAADLGAPHHLDLVDHRRVQREDPLDSLAERDLAHGERGARAATTDADHDTLEHLDALLLALPHLDVHAHGIARAHRGPLGQVGLFDGLNRLHGSLLFFSISTAPAAAARGFAASASASRSNSPCSSARRSSALSSARASRSGRRAI